MFLLLRDVEPVAGADEPRILDGRVGRDDGIHGDAVLAMQAPDGIRVGDLVHSVAGLRSGFVLHTAGDGLAAGHLFHLFQIQFLIIHVSFLLRWLVFFRPLGPVISVYVYHERCGSKCQLFYEDLTFFTFYFWK